MKKILILLAVSVMLYSCGNDKTNNEEPDQQDTTMTQSDEEDLPSTGNFGLAIDDEGALTVEEMMALLKDADSVETKVMGMVSEVCQMKGCWMTMEVGEGVAMRVRFKDYGFFVPKDCAGKEAVMQGKVKKTLISVEELQHYAEDAGESEEEIAKITEPEEEISFLAEGVIIR